MQTLVLLAIFGIVFIGAPVLVGWLIGTGARDDEDQRRADFNGGKG